MMIVLERGGQNETVRKREEERANKKEVREKRRTEGQRNTKATQRQHRMIETQSFVILVLERNEKNSDRCTAHATDATHTRNTQHKQHTKRTQHTSTWNSKCFVGWP